MLPNNVAKIYGYWTSKYAWGFMYVERKTLAHIKFKPEDKNFTTIINKELNEKYFK